MTALAPAVRDAAGRRAWAAARPLGGVALLAVLVWWLGTGPFVAGLRGLGPGTLLAGAAIGAGTTVCVAWRWRVVAGALGVPLGLGAATAASYRAQFLNLALPGGLLGDVHRGVRHGADSGDLGHGVRAVVWERGAGQVVQVALALGVLLVVDSPLDPVLPGVLAVGALAAVVVALALRVLARRRTVGRALRTARAEVGAGVLAPTAWPVIALTSLLATAGHAAVFLVAARATGVDVPLLRLLPLAFVVLLAAAVPLNIGGWGPREGVAAWAFAAAGLGAGQGAAVATAFGVMTLVGTLPGAVVLLAGRRRAREEEARG